jgi:diketogulonate reductase-like aldo/keto reductase
MSLALGVGATTALGAGPAAAQTILRTIPATGEQLPVVGMGSWITFNVGEDEALRAQRAEVLRAFFEAGGTVIDSSPMYGSSEEVIGWGLERLGERPVFAATKVWTPLAMLGPRQMAHSRELWGVERFDLMQIHNLVAWEGHLETLLADKAEGRIRLVGMTTSHGLRHEEIAAVMASGKLDAVQFSYSITVREAEQRLLPLAAERGLAVLINRPFNQGGLLRSLAGKPLPPFAEEIDCTSWAQFCLKFVISHPAVTCAIPATTRVDHMRENMGTMAGTLPDMAMRERMARYVQDL